MVTRSDWEAAHREVVEAARARGGDPPTPEQIEVLSRGDLSDAEADEIRERLSWYPELAAALAADDNAAHDEAPVLTPAQRAADWEALQQRMSPAVSPHVAATRLEQPPHHSRWLTIFPIASTLLFAGLFGVEFFKNRALREELNRPQAQMERVVLFENTARGPGATQSFSLRSSTQSVLLLLTVLDDLQDATATVTIRDLDAKPPRIVWTGTLRRASDGTFPLVVPRSFLTSQSYQLDLAVREQPIATYQLWLANGG